MSMAISGMGAAAPMVMSGASMRTPPAQKMSSLYDKIDAGGSGSISQAQFSQAFQAMNPPASFKNMGAASVWSALDPGQTGSVTRQAFVDGMVRVRAHLAGQGGTQPGAQSPSETAQQSLDALNGVAGNAGGFSAKA